MIKKDNLISLILIGLGIGIILAPLMYRMSIDPHLFDEQCLGSFTPPLEDKDFFFFNSQNNVEPECVSAFKE
jgi:hypothetical protein